ncbi:MAG: type II secretion system protein [Clostridia bacterium]|nr:type II secretion system protein [Clostridia bacterium]
MRLRKWLRSKRAFTLLECVLAVAIISGVSAVLMPLLTMGSSYVGRSKGLDNLSSVAQSMVLSYDSSTTVTNDLTGLTVLQQEAILGRQVADEGQIVVGYSKNLDMTVRFNVVVPGKKTMSYQTVGKFIAVIVKDEHSGTKVVYYDLDPEEAEKLFE